jgi:hypothetical protein
VGVVEAMTLGRVVTAEVRGAAVARVVFAAAWVTGWVEEVDGEGGRGLVEVVDDGVVGRVACAEGAAPSPGEHALRATSTARTSTGPRAPRRRRAPTAVRALGRDMRGASKLSSTLTLAARRPLAVATRRGPRENGPCSDWG